MDDIPSVHDTNVWLHNEAQIWTKVCLNRWRLDEDVQFYIVDQNSWSRQELQPASSRISGETVVVCKSQPEADKARHAGWTAIFRNKVRK